MCFRPLPGSTFVVELTLSIGAVEVKAALKASRLMVHCG